MQSATDAVTGFLRGSGQQRTDVDETVNPAVTSETVMPSRHEETTQAVDKEVHKDHYHTTVQPISHQETLPEQHTHQVAPQIEREFQHGNPEEAQARVASELGQFQNTSTTMPTTTSSSAAQVQGEHIHHHVHETVQPVIHKETLAPEVVHTTIPIHEKHIAPSEHHGMSTLPTKSLGEFSQMTGSTGSSTGTPGLPSILQSGSHSHEEYDGHPRQYDQTLMQQPAPVDIEPEKHDGMHDPEATGHFSQTGQSRAVGSGVAGAATGVAAGSAAGAAMGSRGTESYSTGAQPVSAYELDREVSAGARHEGAINTVEGASAAAYRRTHHGYQTTASSEPSYGKTAHGYLTGADGKMGADRSSGAASSTAATDSTPTASSKDASAHTGQAAAAAGTGVAAESVASGRHNASDQHGAGNRDDSKEPSNLRAQKDDNVQHASKEGEDPSLAKDSSGKLTGSGVDGSHSAVFGLTPDGHKFDDTKHGQKEGSGTSEKMPKREEEEKAARGEGGSTAGVGGDTGSRGAGNSAAVAEQMHDPRVAEKAHGGSADHGPDDNKPVGAGAATSHVAES